MNETRAQLRPCGAKVLIRPVPPAEQTPGGLHIPVEARTPTGLGTVLAVGPGRVNRKGVRVAPDLAPGDTIQYRWIDGREVRWYGEELRFLEAEEIIGRQPRKDERD
jgi:chaperonin GroES